MESGARYGRNGTVRNSSGRDDTGSGYANDGKICSESIFCGCLLGKAGIGIGNCDKHLNRGRLHSGELSSAPRPSSRSGFPGQKGYTWGTSRRSYLLHHNDNKNVYEGLNNRGTHARSSHSSNSPWILDLPIGRDLRVPKWVDYCFGLPGWPGRIFLWLPRT